MIRLALLLSFVFLSSCSQSIRLTPKEQTKLDPKLQMLLEGKNVVDTDYDMTTRTDGAKEYGVIVRGASANDVREAGIRVGSVVGEIMTARVTLSELRTLCDLKSVRSIQNSGRDYPQNK